MSVRLLRGRRLPPPPPVLATALVSGGRGRPVSLRGRGGEKAESPPRHKGPSAGVELRAQAAQLRGKRRDASPREVGKGAAAAALLAPWRRRGCELVVRSVEGEEQPSRGARGAGGDKDQGDLGLVGLTLECWSRAEVEGM